MKEIKFRAWDKTRKQMYVGDELDSIYHNGIIMIVTDNNDWIVMPEDYELMQYTGLKDKNGKEIYEGDIVRIKQYNYDSEWRLCTLTIVSPITFTSDCQFFPTKLVNNRLWEPDTEVIGNIYENPELLEALDEQDR